METVQLGTSELPIEVVIEYMDSLAETYTEDVCTPVPLFTYSLVVRLC